MAKQPTDSNFKFRRHDRIGAAAAEQDEEFLRDCFVDTGDLSLLIDPGDNRVVILGRTGSGKSALISQLSHLKRDTAIPLEPDNLALEHISNSTTLRFYESIGVNLDPFFKLLWRHVLTIEILKKHFKRIPTHKAQGLLDRIKSALQKTSRDNSKSLEAVKYLEQWGDKFWEETEYRVREITQKVEGELNATASAEAKALIGSAATSGNFSTRLSTEEKQELASKGQVIISKAQAQDLGNILQLLSSVLENDQLVYYITIDRLDENWVEDRLRYKLIMALILTSKDFLQVRNAKIILALRRDLIERVFRLSRDSGFQEEKYQSLYLPLEWTKKDLLEILDMRVNRLIRRRYTNQPVGYRNLLPQKISRISIADYLASRAQRPRDIISLFNTCIDAAEGKPKVNVQNFRRAEGEWSRSRFRALGDEWSTDYPRLLDFAAILQGRAPSFKVAEMNDSNFEEFCLERAAEDPGAQGPLSIIALQLVNGTISTLDARKQIVGIFYHVGLVGLKIAPHLPESWVDQLGRGVAMAEIGDDTSIVTHPAFHRQLGISDTRR